MDKDAVEQLLEEELSKAEAKEASNDARNNQTSSSDPRRLGRQNKRDDGDRYSDEREENERRRSRKSRDHAEDEEMKDGSDRGSANGSVRSRRRSRSPGSDRRSRPEHDSYRVRDHLERGHREEDDRYYRPGRRSPDGRSRRERSRERSPRGDDRRADRRGRDHRDRDPRGRQRTPEHSGRRNKTPEPTDDERDRRTIFVQQLAARLRTKELKTFFESVGGVVDAQIVKDRVSGRSKGYVLPFYKRGVCHRLTLFSVGYVEFKDEESVQKAIQLTGQKLLGIPIIVQLTEAEKNRNARNTEGTATQSNGIPFHRLYVGNISTLR